MPTDADVEYFVCLEYPSVYDKISIETTDAAFLQKVLSQLDRIGVQSTMTMTLRGEKCEAGLELMKFFGDNRVTMTPAQLKDALTHENSPNQ